MALPGSPNQLTLNQILQEKQGNTTARTDISLKGLSVDGTADSSGGDITGSPNQTAPFGMGEFHGYSQVTAIHTTTFQPEFRHWFVPYQPIRGGSGFTTSLNSSNNSPTNMGSVTSQGTFALGGKTGVNLASLYNYDSNNGSAQNPDPNGEKIVLQFHHASGSNFTDSGWTTCKIYSGSSNSGTLVVTLTRSSASSFNSVIQNTSNVRATYTFDGTRAFSNHFGTNTTASNNSQHFLEIL